MFLCVTPACTCCLPACLPASVLQLQLFRLYQQGELSRLAAVALQTDLTFDLVGERVERRGCANNGVERRASEGGGGTMEAGRGCSRGG